MSSFPRSAARERSAAPRLIVGAVATVITLVVGGSLLSGVFAKTGPGEVAVVRNGGPAASEIRVVLQPASSLTWAGFFHSTHAYPASQRFYTITADPAGGDKPGVDVESVPTRDGVQVGIEATVYFTLNTDPSVLSTFDDKYGNRTFRSFDGQQEFAWEGSDGWSAFLDQIVRPVISNNFREQIGNFRCQELVSSCALVQNNGAATGSGAVLSDSNQNNVNIAKVQEAVRTGLISDVSSTLGGAFIENFQVNLVKVSLPENVQTAVNNAQAAFAQVTEAQAKVQSAKAEAQANEQRQKGYAACPACAAIDQLKAIPSTITTYAPGAGFAVTPNGR
jgi:regulator of protease activity HflC (stomatin/prohibitin superfamily)